MDIKIPLPILEYENHDELRGNYKYMDDLVNSANWKENLNDFQDETGEVSSLIDRYIDRRDIHGADPALKLREIGLSPGEARKTMDIFQTMSGAILNHHFFDENGKIIKNVYEHYKTSDGPGNKKFNITDVDKLPRKVAESLIELYSLTNSLKSGISLLVAPDKVQFHEKFVKDGQYYSGRVVGENPNLSKFKLYPEIIGTDIAKISGTSSDVSSLAFTAGGLFDWKFVTPQQRTVGSAGNFGSILMDIIFRIMEKPTPETKDITAETEKNTKYIFWLTKNYYEPLITTSVINELEKSEDDFGGAPIDRNPVKIGVKKGEKNTQFHRPDIYALWCIHHSARTVFYDREMVKDEKTNLDIYKFLEYEVKLNSTGNNIEVKPKESNYNEGQTSTIKDKIINFLKSPNSALSIDVRKLITEFNVPVEGSSSLGDESIYKDIVEKLENLDKKAWFSIISQAFTSLYLSLLVAADTDWANLKEQSQIDTSSIPSRMEFKVGGNNVSLDPTERDRVIKLADTSYEKYRNTLKSVLGFNRENTMGGTSLMGSSPLTIQKFGETITYPGDNNVLESIYGYLPVLFTDVSVIEERLKQALYNMSNMYWYRDVVRWLEVLFHIFKPEEIPIGQPQTGLQIKSKFFQIEKILRIMYTKQLKIMMDYIQKTKILQRRLNTSGEINKSLQKQITNLSYYSRSTICYVKRQIMIVYHLLDRTLDSWWTTMPAPAERKRQPGGPVFVESEFKQEYRIMKGSLSEWFRTSISSLISELTDQALIKEVQTLVRDVCDSGKSSRLSEKGVGETYLKDEKLVDIRTDIKFWLLLIANLKNKDVENISSNAKTLQRLYIPVYEKSVMGDNKYYLFDIMPLLLKGNYKGAFGNKTYPQWLTAKDITKMSFPRKNSGIVIVANTSTDVAYFKSWKAISVEWFDKLINNSEDSSDDDLDKKLWFIRNSLFILLSDEQIYNSSYLKKVTINTEIENDPEQVDNPGTLNMRNVLRKLQEYSDTNKEEKSKFISLVSRDYIKNEMNSASVQFHTA